MVLASLMQEVQTHFIFNRHNIIHIPYLYYDERKDIRWNIAWAQGFSKGSGFFSLYILTQVIIQTLSISKIDSSSIVIHGWVILVELIFDITLAAGPIFSNIRPAELRENWKILPSWASNTEEFKFITILFINW